MARNVFHVVPHEERWAVKKEGNERATSTHDTQAETIEAAREVAKEGDSIIIHRPDGTIRERITYAGGASTNGNGSSAAGDQLKPSDIMSVGARVSWGAIVAGLVIAMTTYVTLGAVLAAIGISVADDVEASTLATGTGIASLICVLVALFMGGFVASKLTAGENKLEAASYGLLVWGSWFAMLILFGSGVGFGVMKNFDKKQAFVKAEDLEMTEKAKEEYKTALKDLRQSAENVSPTTIAWVSVSTLIFSIFAAVGGSLLGAGPELVAQVRSRRAARMAVITQKQ